MKNLFPEEKIAFDVAEDIVLHPSVKVRDRLMLVTLIRCIRRLCGQEVPARPWQALEEAEGVPLSPEREAAWLEELRAKDPTVTGEKMMAELAKGKLWMNDLYTVAVYDNGDDGAGGRFLHLSIKRNDRGVVHDWRDLQRIKSELCGPEAEGVELYPAESRVVDMANQYHLWVFTKNKIGFGFSTDGKPEKFDEQKATSLGAGQRAGA